MRSRIAPTFPETIETNSLDLRRFSESYVDVFELYDRFADRREDVEAVFEYVPQEPYAAVVEAREQLDEAESTWDAGAEAQYAVYTDDVLDHHRYTVSREQYCENLED